jgi:Flp pilus assembly pilin Flp
MLHRLRKVRQDNRGVAAIEFALLLPFLITLLVGLLETTFKLWSTAKAEKLTVTLSDVISQSTAVTNSDLQALIGAVDKIMDPFPFGADEGKIIISSIYLAPGETEPVVNWQCLFPTTGGLSAASKFGPEGADANLPGTFELSEKDNIIVTELFFKYTPILPGLLFDEEVVYRRETFKTRLALLLTDPCA